MEEACARPTVEAVYLRTGKPARILCSFNVTMLFIVLGALVGTAAGVYLSGRHMVDKKYDPAIQAAKELKKRPTQEEVDRALDLHWATIRECQKAGNVAAMGFGPSIICLHPGQVVWVKVEPSVF